MGIYARLVRPLAFSLDPERAHRLALTAGAGLGLAGRPLRAFTAVADPRLSTTVAGIAFRTPVGLAAGFDKSGTSIRALAGLGVGFVEIGSVSLDPSDGNPRPRLFRLPEDQAIVVHYGLPNEGAAVVGERVARLRLPVPLGVNLVKTNRGPGAAPERADAIIDEYVAAARAFRERADYLVLNLSCPNTADGRDFFADRGNLDECLAALAGAGLDLPVFLKVSPLGGVAAIERLLGAADRHAFISGFMFNLPPGKPAGLTTPAAALATMPGAVSGKPSSAVADSCVLETWRRMDRTRFAIIGAGGIFTAEDAHAKIRLGASLVQLLTVLVYEGPGVVRRITAGLARLLERDGVANVADASGGYASGFAHPTAPRH